VGTTAPSGPAERRAASLDLVAFCLCYVPRVTRRGRLIATIAAAGLALTPASADAVPCADVAAYPGDLSPRLTFAQWMAHGAERATLPRELPVMGALVASGLENLRGGHGDAVGFFGMRLGIWNKGRYAGYPDNPQLQLQWFVDVATQVRQTRLAAGEPDPAIDEHRWGDWIADVLRPAEQARGRYQLRLAEARSLVGAPCTPPAAGEPPIAPPLTRPAADSTAPALQLSGQRRQRALRAGAIVLTARCPAEPCVTAATVTIVLPRPRRALKIALPLRALAAGDDRRLRFVPDPGARKRIRAALRLQRSIAASVRVIAIDAAGNRSATQTVRVTG